MPKDISGASPTAGLKSGRLDSLKAKAEWILILKKIIQFSIDNLQYSI